MTLHHTTTAEAENGPEITFIDGTAEKVRYAGETVGTVGVSSGVGLKVFEWNQYPFHIMDGFGMSVGMFENLQDMEVDLVHLETDDVNVILTLADIRESEKLSRFNGVFNNIPDENQYVIRVD